MSATRKDITIEPGNDYNEPLVLPRSIGSLEGAEAAWGFKKSPDDVEFILLLTTWDGTLVLEPVGRTLTPRLTEEDSLLFPVGTCVHDVEMRDSTGYTQRPFYGLVNVPAVVTITPFPAPAPSPSPAPSPAPAPSPSPDVFGNSNGDTFGNSSGEEYGPT